MISRNRLTGAAALSLLLLFPMAGLVAQDEEFTEDPIDDSALADEGGFVETPQAAPEQDVEFSVAELEQLAALPAGGQIGKEADEDLTNPTNIFANEARVRLLLGETPKYIYFPDGIDPMIIPWVRAEIVAQELFDEALVAEKNGDWDLALAKLFEIAEQHATTDTAPKVAAARTRIERKKAGGAVVVEEEITGPDDGTVSLPRWVQENTSGIIMAGEPMLLVGDDYLKVGDTVPGFGGVRVKSIAPAEVVYVYQDTEFPLQINGSF